jgi:hypothetical protein
MMASLLGVDPATGFPVFITTKRGMERGDELQHRGYPNE